MTKKPALAPNAIVDLTALHQLNTTNFVEYRSFERQAPSSSSSRRQASSPEQQAASDKPEAASCKMLDPS